MHSAPTWKEHAKWPVKRVHHFCEAGGRVVLQEGGALEARRLGRRRKRGAGRAAPVRACRRL